MKLNDAIADAQPASEHKATLPIRRILVPIDWAELSEHAFEIAVSLARDYGAELIVLNVVPVVPMMMCDPPPENYLVHMQEKLRRCHRPSDPRIRVRYQLAEGVPAAAILRAASETNCDLIVMGTHGRGGLNRFLMGSVAEEVVRKAPCLVLTVNPEAPATLISSGPRDASPANQPALEPVGSMPD